MDIFRAEPTGVRGELRLIGELDISGADALAEAIASIDHPAEPLTFDLARLEFIDSSGLRELLRATRERARRVRLVAPSPAVHRVLEVAGVLTAFDVIEAPPA
ncbi:MAG: STAS domain-containing protein [Actinomycetota bacterium]